MLSRTADHLFWMARYTERAENTARMLDANYQLSLLPQSDEYAELGWRAMLSISELSGIYSAAHHGMKSHEVVDFMARDMSNPSSIVSCLRAARENARAVRSSTNSELWESLNTTWLDCQRMLADGILEREPYTFFEWVKFRSHLSRGVQLGTLVKDDAFYFMRLGTFIERADNTARILDVKFEMMEQRADTSAQPFDYHHWTAVLGSVSGFEVYRRVYRDVITPERVAGLLILYGEWPRSLAASIAEAELLIRHVTKGRETEASRLAAQLSAELRTGRISEILQAGLHAYLVSFLARVNDLAGRISREFLLPIAPETPEATQEPSQTQTQTQGTGQSQSQSQGSA
ncbi:alpha-E domain-containing protein [Caballeronia sp. LP006]|uniref:alpha-E domain-containing protein n=1 Tax=unclassified Caballeronia TaxID=2646786 RepID=UPI0020295C6B|nr:MULTISPECIES: alpha-E domain-containing protein [unclassified Caballeronia]MDR5774112.1 alpha-E domain-containing protein [Caballeronia sp. LZ002]MDR5800279.1 alpha-E domain-containing protein [Caballeronia sp. LZ001]MDR5827610.1 alpha-E domain-containing protein [Caballeronia sp. LP006]MDR5849547.1 alpha-E domain-containing protein [Caballeronia sp. LZ003]